MPYRRLICLVPAVAALLVVAPDAFAQDGAPEAPQEPDRPTAPPAPAIKMVPRAVAPGYVPDAVYLKSGGLVRGTILESAPDDHVTIAMPNGEVRRIPWDDVDHVSANAAAPPAPASPAPPTPKEGPLVRVHISSEHAVLLDRRPAGAETWVPACASPCDEDLPLGDEYRLSGAGLRSSNEFRLQGEPGARVDLSVAPSTKTAWWVGAGVGGMGLVIDLYGLYFIGLGAAIANTPCGMNDPYVQSCASNRSAGTTMRNVGLVMLIPGTVAAVVGGSMMLANWRTGVTQTDGGPAHAASKASEPGVLDAFVRTAEHRGGQLGLPDAPAVYVPITSGKF